MIVDGKRMAAEVFARAKALADGLSHPPHIAAIVSNETAATKSYLSIKERRAADAGCILELERFPLSVTEDELIKTIQESSADALLVQLPLPANIDSTRVCGAIPLSKDADVLSQTAREKFETRSVGALLPPVVLAVQKILSENHISISTKKIVVIGTGYLVGEPCAVWLKQEGGEVETVNARTPRETLVHVLQEADIIVSGAGAPHFIKPEMLKEGVVLIDAGTSESSGVVVGDADPACAEKCSLFTPVPGGVGPLALACLFENAVSLAERATSYP